MRELHTVTRKNNSEKPQIQKNETKCFKYTKCVDDEDHLRNPAPLKQFKDNPWTPSNFALIPAVVGEKEIKLQDTSRLLSKRIS